MTELSATIETLRGLVREVKDTSPEALDADDDMVDTFGLSSVDVMELISLVEDTWDVGFPLNDLASIRTLRQLAQRVLDIRAGA